MSEMPKALLLSWAMSNIHHHSLERKSLVTASSEHSCIANCVTFRRSNIFHRLLVHQTVKDTDKVKRFLASEVMRFLYALASDLIPSICLFQCVFKAKIMYNFIASFESLNSALSLTFLNSFFYSQAPILCNHRLVT